MALDLTQPSQTSITSPDKVSSEVVEAQSGNEGQGAVEGKEGPPSTDRKVCSDCLKKQEICPTEDNVFGLGVCTICKGVRQLFKNY